MKRSHWGEFEDDTVKKKELRENEIILPISKLEQFRGLTANFPDRPKDEKILIKNALVTQTVETINQTQCLQTLLDTYTNKSGFTDLWPPNIDFPQSNSARMKSNDNIFSKPLWFCRPSNGKPPPKNYAQLTKPVVLEVLKKALCGLLKIAGFTEIDESALIMFVDAIDEFYKSFMENVRTMAIDREDQSPELDVGTLEKAYVNLSNKSLTTLHNYFKEILRTNRQEIAEFKEAEFEYEKLLHENNLAQNLTGLAKDNNEFISFLDTSAVAGNGNIMSFLDSENFRNIMDDVGQDNIPPE